MLFWEKNLAHIHDIYFPLVKKAESVLILKENKLKPKKLVIIVLTRKLISILQAGFKNNAYFDCVTWKETT